MLAHQVTHGLPTPVSFSQRKTRIGVEFSHENLRVFGNAKAPFKSFQSFDRSTLSSSSPATRGRKQVGA
jgi:hypothetical protein